MKKRSVTFSYLLRISIKYRKFEYHVTFLDFRVDYPTKTRSYVNRILQIIKNLHTVIRDYSKGVNKGSSLHIVFNHLILPLKLSYLIYFIT